ncbi:MAG TPA: hypothetical protein VMV17_01280 [Streptosporangiaceae bacterium]|nr:hypothetical protein [Streptosporangiaceae bacterium]
MTCYMFQLTVQPGQHSRLRELNEQYEPVLARVAAGIHGLNSIEKWLLGAVYIERVDFDGEFADFAKQLTADKEVRQFLRSVGECFAESLREMPARGMSCLQALPT